MQLNDTYTKLQLAALILLRYLIGWHILYEGLAKLINPYWSSLGFLRQSKGVLSRFAQWVISTDNILSVVDFLNTWGLIAIGLGLLLGLFARIASVIGAVLIFIYYLNNPPFIGVVYTPPVDGNYLIVDKTLIEAVALCVLALFPTSRIFGFDAFCTIRRRKRRRKEE